MTSVSIGMPVYNAEKYLDGALAALSTQTFSDLRIIISDNASTDTTPDIISAWAARDARITHHRQSENIGAMANFEWVLRRAESPWFMFAAYDDLWSPNYVEVLYSAAMKKPGIKLAASQIVLMDNDGRKGRRSLFYDPICDHVGLHRIRVLLKRACSSWIYGLFSREALITAWDASSRFKYTWARDYLVLLPILLSGDVTGNNDAVFYQRETGISDVKYKPKSLDAQKDIFRTFLRESMRILQDVQPTKLGQLALLPSLLSYTNSHAWKLRRLIRSELKEILMISGK